MNDELRLESLGFKRFPEWDWEVVSSNHYRLDTDNLVFRAFITRDQGLIYAQVGLVVNIAKGYTRFLDCLSDGSIEKLIEHYKNKANENNNNPNISHR